MMIHPLEWDHLDSVAAIEDKDGDAHWSRAQFEKELAGEFRRFFVAAEPPSSDILGYGGYWKAGPEAQITNLVVRRESRCKGIGQRFSWNLFWIARAGKNVRPARWRLGSRISMRSRCIRISDLMIKATRSKIYQNPEEDAVLMEKQL